MTTVSPSGRRYGKRVAYRSNRAGEWNLFWRPSDGSGPEERLTTADNNQLAESFSPDGQLLAFDGVNRGGGMDTWVFRLSNHRAEPLLQSTANRGAHDFLQTGDGWPMSPTKSGGFEVYVQPYPGATGKWRVSVGGGARPLWNVNGRELFYVNDDKMMAVDILTSPSFSAGTPKILFEDQDLTNTRYDVSPDGQRFLMVKKGEQATSATQINVVLNWFEELKRRVPSGK